MKILSSSIRELKEKGLKDIPTDFPTELLNEEWAKKIHGQSLARLDERGGMSVTEILINVLYLNLDYHDKGDTQSRIDVLNMLKKQKS